MIDTKEAAEFWWNTYMKALGNPSFGFTWEEMHEDQRKAMAETIEAFWRKYDSHQNQGPSKEA